MYIVYRKNILQQLDKVIDEAISKGVVIEEIYLNDDEFNEYKYLRGWGLYEEYRSFPIKYLKEK